MQKLGVSIIYSIYISRSINKYRIQGGIEVLEKKKKNF